MKKVFLAASVLGTLVASAQQDDFFDIQKHLKKKAESKNPLANIYTQPHVQSWQSGTTPFSTSDRKNLYLELIRKRKHSLNRQALGSMPCLTTDLTAYNMPNCFNPTSAIAKFLQPGELPGKMPNAADVTY
jgi:hypothetical protein